MQKLITVGAVGAGVVGGAIAVRSLSRGPRRSLGAAVGRRTLQRMERLMARLPEDSPPRLIMSVLPRLREQNEQIIAMLREQNELLRQQLQAQPQAAHGAAPREP